MRKSVFFDDETLKQLNTLDSKMNLKSNHSAVIRLAIQRLYEEEMKKDGGTVQSRKDGTDRHD